MPLYSFDPLEAEITVRRPRTRPRLDETSIPMPRPRVLAQIPGSKQAPIRSVRRVSNRAA